MINVLKTLFERVIVAPEPVNTESEFSYYSVESLDSRGAAVWRGIEKLDAQAVKKKLIGDCPGAWLITEHATGKHYEVIQ